jgi:hypothetical protein
MRKKRKLKKPRIDRRGGGRFQTVEMVKYYRENRVTALGECVCVYVVVFESGKFVSRAKSECPFIRAK